MRMYVNRMLPVFPYEIARLAEDIAGGLMVTAPSEKDFRDPKLGAYIEKYLKGVNKVPTENRLRILRLIENLTLGTAAVGYRTESIAWCRLLRHREL